MALEDREVDGRSGVLLSQNGSDGGMDPAPELNPFSTGAPSKTQLPHHSTMQMSGRLIF